MTNSNPTQVSNVLLPVLLPRSHAHMQLRKPTRWSRPGTSSGEATFLSMAGYYPYATQRHLAAAASGREGGRREWETSARRSTRPPRGGHRGAGPLRMWACVPSGLGCSAPPFPAVLAVPTWHARPPWWGHRILAARSTRLPHDLLPIRCPFSVDTVHRSTSTRTSRPVRPSTRQAYPDSRRHASIQGR